MFLPLAQSLTEPGIAALRARLEDHGFLARQADEEARARYGLARYATKVPMQLGDPLEARDGCRALLERYPELDDVGQSLVVGIVRYVIEIGDLDDDSDARIVKFVLARASSRK